MHWFQNRHLFMFEMIMEEEEKAPFLWMQLCDIKLKSVVILFQMTISFFFSDSLCSVLSILFTKAHVMCTFVCVSFEKEKSGKDLIVNQALCFFCCISTLDEKFKGIPINSFVQRKGGSKKGLTVRKGKGGGELSIQFCKGARA